MLASREAILVAERSRGDVSGSPIYCSPIVRGGHKAMKISVPVAGADALYLYVLGAPDVVGGAANWADARLIGVDGGSAWLDEIRSVELFEGRLSTNATLESGVGGPLHIAGRKFDRGLQLYAYGKLRVPLTGRYRQLEAWIGIDDWVKGIGAVQFVVADGRGAQRLDLWQHVARDFPAGEPRREMRRERMDRIWDEDWKPGDWRELALRYARACRHVPALAVQAERASSSVIDAATLQQVRNLYHRACSLHEAVDRARRLDTAALQLAIADLKDSYGDKYPQGSHFLRSLAELQKSLSESLAGLDADSAIDRYEQVAELVRHFDRLRWESLVQANPLLDFNRLLVIERTPKGDARRPTDTGYGMGEYLGLPRQSSKCIPGIEEPFAWDNTIATLEVKDPAGPLATVYQPEGGRLVTDLDVHWDADRMLFSMPGTQGRWQIFESGCDGRGARQVSAGEHPDVDNYDACYLPNGKVAFESTAPLQGVPCNAGVIVGMTYVMDADGRNVRQICFEQDHNYCPSVMNDGRILYMRWDYTDTPHVWNRMLFTMNPDGTGQTEFYGSNSYWPNAIFYARAVPEHPTKVVGIVTGHHVGRVGELVIFDPARGRRETQGVVQRIPGRGKKVEPLVEDKLTEHSWPKFLHPFPLSEKYFLVACKPTPEDLWGIYLADVFDNLVLIHEVEGRALLEPIPLRKTPRPPMIPDRVMATSEDSSVYMADVYAGSALAGIPRGTIKKLRVLTYHFGYQRLAGIDHRVGADGPWEAKRVLGTVPVEPDGSALFRIPAKTPISVQPLDGQGRAVALMRSWMTAMPGETLSCVGCHENRNTAPPSLRTLAVARKPSTIEPWYGPSRGFSFRREVQPVLDRYCVGCHNEQPRDSGPPIADLRGNRATFVVYRGGNPRGEIVRDQVKEKLLGRYGGIFEPSYVALRSLIRVGGLESDLHELLPMEYHADTSELVQMLRKGHHGVELDAEAWDRLITWIDLNAPCHGTWSEITKIPGDQRKRRLELQRQYGGVALDVEAEAEPESPPRSVTAVIPAERKTSPNAPALAGWPLSTAEAQRRQQSTGSAARTLDLGNGIQVELVRIPAGRFVMGDAAGVADESPVSVQEIDRPFWMSRCEITNRQFAQFDAAHESRFEDRTSWIFSQEYLGWPLDGPQQPVVRVSWHQAMAFCDWLSRRTPGLRLSLPTEAQWEYACRAGTATPMNYGQLDEDFSTFANMADHTIRDLAYTGWRPLSPDLVPRDDRFRDGALVTADAGRYRANVWGLCDMHGNAAEWTLSQYRRYPYDASDGRNDKSPAAARVVRGGSWYDRPHRCRSSFRLAYEPYQHVFNVGFRIAAEETR